MTKRDLSTKLVKCQTYRTGSPTNWHLYSGFNSLIRVVLFLQDGLGNGQDYIVGLHVGVLVREQPSLFQPRAFVSAFFLFILTKSFRVLHYFNKKLSCPDIILTKSFRIHVLVFPTEILGFGLYIGVLVLDGLHVSVLVMVGLHVSVLVMRGIVDCMSVY